MKNQTGLLFSLIISALVGFASIYFGLGMMTDIIGNKWSAFGALLLVGMVVAAGAGIKGADMDMKKNVKNRPAND